MKRFGKILSILLALALASAGIGFCAAADEEPPQAAPAETQEESGPGADPEEVSGAENENPEDVKPDPETQGTGEETAGETEKTEAVSDGMPLEEATEQPAESAGENPPVLPAEDPSGTEEDDGDATEAEKEPESREAGEPEDELKDEPEDEPKGEPEEPEDTETVLNLDKCKTVSGIVTGEAPFSVKASDNYSRIVIFTLTVPEENSVSVLLDSQPVSLALIENENPDDTDFRYVFEIPLLAGRDYSITLKAEHDGEIPFTLSIRKKPDENPEDAIPEPAEDETAQEEDGEKEIPETSGDIAEPEESGEEAETGTEDGENRFPDDFAIHFNVSWEGEELHFGDTAHFYVTAEGDEGIDYSILWQWSEDNENWNTVEGEDGKELDLTVTEDNYLWYWRIKAKLPGQD